MRIVGEYGQRLAQGLRAQAKPGALILCDTFQAAPGEPAHGLLAAKVARQQGFQGPILAVNFEDPQDPSQTQRNDRLNELVQGWGEASEPAEIREKLYESMLFTRLQAVETATDRLAAVAQAGVQNAALNFSLGSTAAMCVTAVLGMCEDPQATSQLTRALGPDFRPALVEVAQRTSQDPRLQAARAEFAETVHVFEQGHNSVVVAAGNDGNVARPAPDGFTLSDLVTPETTVVGALEGGEPASYNGAGITNYADGSAFGAHGTSFAAPRVAGELAGLHARFPAETSTQVCARLTAPRED